MTSAIKGFLCSQDGTYNFPLMPKLTTIGRENCEILISQYKAKGVYRDVYLYVYFLVLTFKTSHMTCRIYFPGY